MNEMIKRRFTYGVSYLLFCLLIAHVWVCVCATYLCSNIMGENKFSNLLNLRLCDVEQTLVLRGFSSLHQNISSAHTPHHFPYENNEHMLSSTSYFIIYSRARKIIFLCGGEIWVRNLSLFFLWEVNLPHFDASCFMSTLIIMMSPRGKTS